MLLLPALLAYAAAIALSGHPGYDVLRDGWIGNAALAAPGLFCIARAVTGRRDRRASFWLGAAMLSFAAGNVAYVASIQFQVEPAVPSLADIGYLGFYPLASAGVIALLRREGSLSRGVVLDGLLGAVGAATALAVVLNPVLAGLGGGDLAEVMVTGAYPVGDLLLVSLIAGALSVRRAEGAGAIVWLAAGLMLFCAADVAYALRVSAGTYEVGTPLDLLWAAGMAVMAAGMGRTVHAAAPRERDSVAVLAAPLVATITGAGVLLWATRAEVPDVTVGLATASLVLAAGRTLTSFRELQRLADARRQARTDDLTGLANRRALYEQAELRLGAAGPGDRLGLLLIDLDGFKEINDALGHHAGDELLTEVARSLGARTGGDDVLARLGGDEYALLVPLDEEDDAVAIARHVLDRVAEPRHIEGVRMQVRASVGVAEFPADGATLSALLRRADIAMYEAKRRHSGVERYVPALDRHSRVRLQVAQDLADAIDGDQLVLHYQPRCDVRTGHVAGVEALVRWQHPEHGLLMPDAFLDQVERSGLMPRFTGAVLAIAARQARAWQDEGLSLPVAINLSVSDLLDEELPRRIAALLAEHDLAPEALEVEVTESLLLTDPVRARGTLAAVRALGVAVAIDDYGTGYSSPAHLRDLPADQLKIDRSFIAEMGDDPRIAAIVRSTVELGHALGLEVVAEGVEDADALDRLAAMGCEWAQGYHFSRPLPPAELAAWVALPEPA